MTGFGLIGATALWLTFAWLLSAIVCSYLSERKGYGIKLGLGLGMLTLVIGVVIMLFLPAREGSDWRVLGPVGRGKQGV